MARHVASAAGAALDSHLLRGGGTDDTAALQRVLDRAKDGEAVHLVLDGPALVSGLDVYSNTTIECIDGAGLYLKDHSYRAVLRNGNRTSGSIVDRDITLRGGLFNGNRLGQSELQPWREDWTVPNRERDGTTISGLQFFGVDGLTIEGAFMWDARAYAIWVANVSHVTMRDVRIDFDFEPYPDDASPAEQRTFLDGFRSNLDGIHVNGPARHLTFENLRLRTEDDALALNANDWMVLDFSEERWHGPYVAPGPISDVVIRDVVLDDAFQGIRLLSADQRIDRVLVENVSGTVRGRMAVLSHFFIPDHHGNIGTVTFRNIDVDPTPSASWRDIYPDWYARQGGSDLNGTNDLDEEGERPLFSIAARIERLDLDGVSATTTDDRPVVRLGSHTHLAEFDAQIRLHGSRQPEFLLRVEDDAVVERLRLSVHDARSS
jgi:hypothetical protein